MHAQQQREQLLPLAAQLGVWESEEEEDTAGRVSGGPGQQGAKGREGGTKRR